MVENSSIEILLVTVKGYREIFFIGGHYNKIYLRGFSLPVASFEPKVMQDVSLLNSLSLARNNFSDIDIWVGMREFKFRFEIRLGLKCLLMNKYKQLPFIGKLINLAGQSRDRFLNWLLRIVVHTVDSCN